MTFDQAWVFGVLAATMGLFVWGRWRYDVVAMLALLAVALPGIIKPAEAFAGFGHPAVITVAAVLVLSRGLQNSGLIGWIGRGVVKAQLGPSMQVGVVVVLVAVLSGFINNVGALALLMPVVLQISRNTKRPPGELLMPLAFGSLLGGMLTLIGTPPNIIIASVRANYGGGGGYDMFDFFPVGLAVMLVGVTFITLVGWRLVPVRREGGQEHLFEISDYITELTVPEGSKLVDHTIREAYEMGLADDAIVAAIMRGDQRRLAPRRHERILAGDTLLIEGDAKTIEESMEATGLQTVGTRRIGQEDLNSESISVAEVVVSPGSRLTGRTAGQAGLGWRHSLNLLAIARQGEPIRRKLTQVRFQPGDVLLLQGEHETMPDALRALGCLPLAQRDLAIHRKPSFTPLIIFGLAILATGIFGVPAPLAFVAAAVAMVWTAAVPAREVYDAIDWPVIVLLGALVPVGGALESSGGTELIAAGVADISQGLPIWATLALVLVIAMFLSDVMNNAATAVLMGPLAAQLAIGLDASPDPFLMAVAVGSSCAFLTPIGHQSNILVMGPGGYRFGDYWRMGAPLEALIVVVGVPAILWVWPA